MVTRGARSQLRSGVAIDTSGNVWTVNFGSADNLLVESDSSGTQNADPSGYASGNMNAPYGIAIDGGNNIWVTNQGGNGSLTEFNSSGTAVSPTGGYVNGGLDSPSGLAIDGLGNIWIANFFSSNPNFNGSISEFNSSGMPISGANGYVGSGINQPYSLAVDPSGNVWVAADNGASSVTEFARRSCTGRHSDRGRRGIPETGDEAMNDAGRAKRSHMVRRISLLVLTLAALVLPLHAQTGCDATLLRTRPSCWPLSRPRAHSLPLSVPNAAASRSYWSSAHHRDGRLDAFGASVNCSCWFAYSVANTMMNLRRILLVLSASMPLAAIAGCGGVVSTTGGGGGGACTPAIASTTPPSCPTRTPVAGVSINGKVSAGLQPVSGASVQLYAAGIAGNGSAPTALLNAAVATSSTGAFTVPSGYTCPSTQTPIYLISKGGQPGAGSANQSLWLMTALGPCGSVTAGSNVVLNEVSTAASAWALASFMSSGGSVGASCTNTLGLDNAFLTASSLENAITGVSPGAGNPSTLTVSSSKLNTLANALSSCTASSAGAACSSLFSAASSGNVIPGNTLDAALNIVHSPGNNVAATFALASGSAAFSPALHAAPPDWMLHNTIAGGGMNLPASVGVAASGNIWVSSYFSAVSEFLPGGAPAFPSGIGGNGLNQSYGMALDIQGNVWIANEQTSPNNGSGNVDELNSSGAAVASGLTAGGINYPVAVAADSNGNMWFANYGDSTVTVLNGSGTPVSSATGWGSKSLVFPVALAIDSSHNAWVANQAGLLPITRISADGSLIANYNCDCNGASGVATDQSGNVWIANYYGNSISEVNTCGTLELDSAMGGGVNHPQGIAVDGAGTVWVGNYLGNSLSQLDGASSKTPGTYVSPSSGFGTDASLLEPYGLAVDASGDVWVSNFGNNTLTQFIGIASPVKTPLAGPPQQP